MKKQQDKTPTKSKEKPTPIKSNKTVKNFKHWEESALTILDDDVICLD